MNVGKERCIKEEERRVRKEGKLKSNEGNKEGRKEAKKANYTT